MRLKLILCLGMFSLLIACQETGKTSTNDNLITDSNGNILLQSASLNDLESEVTNYHGMEVLRICHVPPGNPKKSKSMYIPLPAVEAHLKHGHNSHDHIGFCLDSFEEDDESSDDDSSSEDDSSDDSSSDDRNCSHDDDSSSDDNSSSDGGVDPAPGDEGAIDVGLCEGMTEEEIAACF